MWGILGFLAKFSGFLLDRFWPSKDRELGRAEAGKTAAEREVEHGKDRIKIDDEVSQLDADALADELRKHNRRR